MSKKARACRSASIQRKHREQRQRTKYLDEKIKSPLGLMSRGAIELFKILRDDPELAEALDIEITPAGREADL
jgi:hypothetical protein